MKNFFAVSFGVAFGLTLWSVISHFSPISFTNGSSTTAAIEISYIDMVSLMLTGVTIILAALGFVLAILAFLGWKSIQSIAEDSAREVVREAISDGGKLETLLKKEVQYQLRYQGVEVVDLDFEEGNGAENQDDV